MKKHRWIVILLILILIRCTGTPAQNSFPAQTPTLTSASTKTLAAITPSINTPTLSVSPSFTPTQANTPTIEPTSIPCEGTGILCLNVVDGKEITGDFRYGVWSPTENRIVFANTLDTFSSPDFQMQKILPSVEGFGPSWPMIWKPDGKRILFFAMNYNEPDSWKAQYNQLWFAGTTGPKAYPLNKQFTSRNPEILGWVGSDVLAVGSDCTHHICLDLLNAQSGAVEASAYFRGTADRPNDQYVPAMYSTYFSVHLLVIGKNKTGLKAEDRGEQENLEYGKWFLFEGLKNFDNTFFADWLPGTNQMLVSWISEANQEHRLYLWDIDQDTSKPIVPDGLTGTFSPEGKILAYLSNGPARLDENQKPVTGFVEGQKDFQPYVQLDDMSTGKVFGSFPVQANVDFTLEFPEYHVSYEFSPDGRYFAFVSDRAVQLNEKGWPVFQDENQAEKNGAYLTVLDLQARKMILSRKGVSSLPVWSPVEDQFVYQNSRNEVVLFTLGNSGERTITRPISKETSLKWSFDGAYLSIEVPPGDSKTSVGFVKVR